MHLLRCSQGVGQARQERRSPSTRVALTRCGTENGHHLAAVDPADEQSDDVALQQVEPFAFAQVDGDGRMASPSHGFGQTAVAAEDVQHDWEARDATRGQRFQQSSVDALAAPR